MSGIQGIYYDSNLQLLVCGVHGAGVHPNAGAIKRHLRGKGHFCKGGVPKKAVRTLIGLPLKSRDALRNAHPPAEEQPILPIPHLTIHAGWNCQLCSGKELTTSEVLRNRHVAKLHQAQRDSHGSIQPSWEPCELQTLFAMTGDIQYFRVSSTTPTARALSNSGRAVEEWPNLEHATVDRCEPSRQADEFPSRMQAQKQESDAIAKAAANVNPDPKAEGAGQELWIKQLGISRYVAGLHKDEMADSYKHSDTEDSAALKDLRDISIKILRETWKWCQHGPEQRLTDPQAGRISSFWYAADPERKNKSFRRGIGQDTLETHLSHWTQMLTFLWNGWQGELFPNSLAALAGKATRPEQSTRQTCVGGDQSANSGDHRSSHEDGSNDGDEEGEDDSDVASDKECFGQQDPIWYGRHPYRRPWIVRNRAEQTPGGVVVCPRGPHAARIRHQIVGGQCSRVDSNAGPMS